MLQLELTIQGLINGSMYALMAVGLTLVYGLLRILHVAHAGLYTLGAYIAVLIANASGSLLLGAAVAIPAVGLAGMAVYRLLYEPILDRPPYVALIASIGLFIVMEEAYRLVFGPYGETFSTPYLAGRLAIGPIGAKGAEVLMVIAAFGLLTLLALLARRTRFGVAWRATVSDPAMARSFGVDTIKVRYVNFFVASGLAASAAILVAVLNNLVEPTMGSVPSYKTLAIIVLGGLGNVAGTLAASLALGVIEAFGTIYIGHLLDRDAIAFLFLVLVLMIRPQGLFAAK
ncbi:MAG: branched-chain amino acid ABC transporter permease [Alphaproteobacteria bacterium]|nr:branched-chain amino acid ABC transporter permease [Alphaproteobacteria bacterium]